MFGTDMTIGADTALQRIIEAVDAISSTAASHHRSFIVEVMGRHCGYLALMGAIAAGADWVLIPENPSQSEDWAGEMCASLKASRLSGRSHNIVILAEGAQDKYGNPITSMDVKQAIETQLGEDARITILGHVQRGGAPSAFDRYLGTIQGFRAVEHLLAAQPTDEPQLIGIRQNNVVTSSLQACVEQTLQVASLIDARDYEQAMTMRGGSFAESYQHFRTIIRSQPNPPLP
jgi:6-phosphofructokinase 1